MRNYVSPIISTVIAGILVVSFFVLYNKRKRSPFRGKESLFAGVCWLVLFVSGLTFQLLFQFSNETNQNALSVVMNSIDRSIGMFSFVFKQDNVVSAMWNGAGYKRLYAILAFVLNMAAGIWTYYFVVFIFFLGIHNSFRVFLHRVGWIGTNYIVVGCNEQTDIFLANLKNENKKPFAFDDVITIITGRQTGDRSMADAYKKYLDAGFAVIAGEANEETLRKAGMYNKRRRIFVIAMTGSDEQNLVVAKIVADEIAKRVENGFKLQFEKYEKQCKKQSEKEKKSSPQAGKTPEKIRADAIKTVKKEIRYEIVNKLKLDARIEYRFIERTEHFKFAEAAFGRVNFFNPYELRARKFFYEHPITDYLTDSIDREKARLKGEIGEDGLIINEESGKPYKIANIFLGFGDINYQMLKTSIMQTQLLGVNYNAVVFSKDVDESEPVGNQAKFMHQALGLFHKGVTGEILRSETEESDRQKAAIESDKAIESASESNESGKSRRESPVMLEKDLELIPGMHYLESPKERFNIRFRHSDILSKSFYVELREELKDADCAFIYVALGKNEINIETSLELRQMIATYGIDLNKIRIFMKVKDKLPILSTDSINGSDNIPLSIEPFGLDSEVYAPSEIVAMSLDVLAMTLSNQHHGKHWGQISEFEKDSNRAKILNLPVALGLVGFKLEKSDAAKTAKGKMEKSQNEGDPKEENTAKDPIEEFKKRFGVKERSHSPKPALKTIAERIEAKIAEIEQKEDPDKKKEKAIARLSALEMNDNRICDTAKNNLARLEHLRWNVFSIVNGWTKKPIEQIGSSSESGDNIKKLFPKKGSASIARFDASEVNSEVAESKAEKGANGEKGSKKRAENPSISGSAASEKPSDDKADDIEYYGRKNALTKQHACITTFEELVRLRRIQAYLSLKKRRYEDIDLLLREVDEAAENGTIPPELEGKYDTISYDYDVINDLPTQLPKVENYRLAIISDYDKK